jgi:hypothetical protein
MDLIEQIKGYNSLVVGADFDYVKATTKFNGLKLFPIVRTDNLKVQIMQLVEGGELPVIALVHALDTEARIGDRPELEEYKYELNLVKESLFIGEELIKKLKDTGITKDEKKLMEAIFNDARNVIMRILTRFEAMAWELIGSGKITIKENNVNKTVDFRLPNEHRLNLGGWSNTNTDIIADLVAIKEMYPSIVRAFTSSKIIGYMVKNAKIITIAEKAGTYPTSKFVINYINDLIGIEFIMNNDVYNLTANGNEKKRFFPDNVISFVETKGEIGKTFSTSTPSDDFNSKEYNANEIVSVTFDTEKNPNKIITIGEGYALPVLANNKGLYILTIGA